MKVTATSSGQALLLVLLSTAIVVTIALSVVSRTISDVSQTITEEESLRAFSAAEAGVEEVLVSGLGEGGTADKIVSGEGEPDPTTYQVSVTRFPESASEFIYPVGLPSGDSATVWLVSHDANNELTCNNPLPCYQGAWIEICWGVELTSAIEASILYQPINPAQGLRLARTVIDPSGTIPGAATVDQGRCQVEGKEFLYHKRLSFTDLGISSYDRRGSLKLMKIRSLLNSSPQTIAVNAAGSGATFPSQGKKIQSTGSSGSANRKIEVYQLYSSSPSIFDVAIFSQSGITK